MNLIKVDFIEIIILTTSLVAKYLSSIFFQKWKFRKHEIKINFHQSITKAKRQKTKINELKTKKTIKHLKSFGFYTLLISDKKLK